MNSSRRYLTPPNKRKSEFDAVNSDRFTKTPRPGSPRPAHEPASNNILLAGYLAHEILTKGTLFGEQWDSARAEAGPVLAAEPGNGNKQKRYVEIASLMKTDGAHIGGVINPAQLAHFLHM